MWDAAFRELKHSIRVLRTRPGFSSAVILTIALGIASNATIFSAIDTILLRSLPYKDPEQILTIWNRYGKTSESRFRASVSPPDYFDRVEQSKTLESVAVYTPFTFDLTGRGEPKRLRGCLATASFFELFGVQASHGRFPTVDEDQVGKNRVAVISYSMWNRDYGRDADIVGRQIILNGNSYMIVGVMPQSFRFPDPEVSIWAPIAFTPEDRKNEQRGNEYLAMIGRMKQGVTLAQAETEMEMIASRVPINVPERREFLTASGWGAIVIPLHEFLVAEIKPALLILMAAVFCVFLIVCANVSHLMLVRYSERRKDIAIRAALGADRWQLMRTLFFESTILSLAGGVLGLILANWGLSILTLLAPVDVSFFDEVQINFRIVGFALLLSLLLAFVLALLPIYQFRKTHLQNFIKESSLNASSKSARHYALVSVEIGLALILFIGAVLLMKSFLFLLDEQPGFESENRITFALSTPQKRYPERIHRAGFYTELLSRLRSMGNVKAAGASGTLPLTGENWTATFVVEGHPPAPGQPDPGFQYRIATPGWIRAMGIPIKFGRDFDERDTADSMPVALIDESLAKRYWGGTDAIGKRIGFGEHYHEIVGIVGSVKNSDLQMPSKEQVYLAHTQLPISSMFVVIHTEGNPLNIVSAVRSQVSNIDPAMPIDRIRTMDQILSDSVARPRFQTSILSFFAVLSFLLAIIGIYGVTSYSVRQLTREIGIRMALGATNGRVIVEIVSHGLKAALIGIVSGIVISLALSRILSSVVFKVRPTDPSILLATAMLMFVVACLASYFPARRASKVNPVIALHYE